MTVGIQLRSLDTFQSIERGGPSPEERMALLDKAKSHEKVGRAWEMLWCLNRAITIEDVSV